MYRWNDCEQTRSRINQQLIAGRFGHEGFHQLRTKQFWQTQIDYFNRVSTEDYVVASFTFTAIYTWEKDGLVGQMTSGVIKEVPTGTEWDTDRQKECRPTWPRKQRTSEANSIILL